MVNKLKLAIRITDRFSFRTIDEIVVWARKIFSPEEITLARYALKEEAFFDRSALFMVMGIPLTMSLSRRIQFQLCLVSPIRW